MEFMKILLCLIACLFMLPTTPNHVLHLFPQFYAIDFDGSGGLDFKEFTDFLQEHVLDAGDRKWPRANARAKRDARMLTLEHALQIYIRQQVKAHKNNR